MAFRFPKSLKKQFIYTTLVIGGLIIGLSVLMYINMLYERDQVALEVENVDQRLQSIQGLRKNLVALQFALDRYLLDSTQISQKLEIERSLSESQKLIAPYLQDSGSAQIDDAYKILHLNIEDLSRETQKLISVRADVRKQYPGMAISAFEMRDIQYDMDMYLSLLVNEIESDLFQPTSPTLFPLLLKSRTQWVGLISQMRIYLANRLAAFSMDILTDQAQSVVEIGETLQTNFFMLETLYQVETDSFEGRETVAKMQKTLQHWMDKFDKMRQLSESMQWRQDWNILENSIIPLAKNINLSLDQMEKLVHASERQANERLEKNSNGIFILLATTITCGILYIIIMIYLLNRLIFNPIATLTASMRAKAFDQEMLPVAIRHSEETLLLQEAFDEMDQKISQRQQALEHQSFHDSLTALPNSILLGERINYFIESCQNSNGCFVLIIIGLDNLLSINESYGHQVAEELLLQITSKLKTMIGESDVLARPSTCEFSILTRGLTPEEIENFAQSLSKKFDEPLSIEGQSISLPVYIGIASYPKDGTNQEQLQRNASIAMNYGKRNSLPVVFFDADNDDHQKDKLTIFGDLRNDLYDNKLTMDFQPQISLGSTEISGVEALLRWKHPKHGAIRPDKIIEMAEQGGILDRLCIWTIEYAFRNLKKWHASGYLIPISINLSVKNLEYASLCDVIQQNLENWGIDPGYVVFEITESGMMNNPGRSIEVLNRLHKMGVTLSVDDFGTGFSSLSYLQKLPIQEVKIDKSFVMPMDKNNADTIIVESVINLGHNLGLQVVAEGIENETVLELVGKLGCDIGQGNTISKPLTEQNFMLWLKKNISSHTNNVANLKSA